MYIKRFDIKDLSSMNIKTTDFAQADKELAVKKINRQAMKGEAFTLCKNKNKFYASCGLFSLDTGVLFFWMIVDEELCRSDNNKKEFLLLCNGLKKLITAKYHKQTAQCLIVDKETKYHTFALKLGFKKMGTLYSGTI